ncbi:hypothetical protein Leryth_020029 [Lithospermum erythrorhizon]|nr:hypothetical protein Leryth_020029 [Lithospermum erythrorhizon]
MAVLRKKAAFIMFVITDTISVITSTIAIVLHFAATFYHDNGRKLHHRYSYALVLILVAMLTMLMAFVSGLYCVLHRSPRLAITVCFLGCIGIFCLCCLVMKAYKDVSRHESPSLILRGLVSKEDEDPPRHENLNVILREIHTE